MIAASVITILSLFVAACGGGGAGTGTTTDGSGSTGGTQGSSDPGPSSPSTPDELVVLQGSDLTTLFNLYSSSLPDTNVLMHMFDTIMVFDDDVALQPYLAEYVRPVDDLTWEVKLKEGRTFHNGEPLNAEAVKFALEYGLELFENNEGDVQYLYNQLQLDRVEVVDEYTAHIITKQPVPILPYHLAHLHTAPLPPQYYSENTPDFLAMNPVGSGPYRFVEWIPGERAVIEAWPDYPDGPAPIERIVWRAVPEAATRIAELRAGNAHAIVNVPPDLAEQIDSLDNARLEWLPGMRRVFVGIKQTRHPALTDVRVRQALNYAFDCESMMDNLLAGRGECSAHIINAPYGSPNVTAYPYDPDRARQLLAEAGWEDRDGDGVVENAAGEPLRLVLESPRGRYVKDAEIAQVIASDLERIGIDVDFQVFEWSVYAQKSNDRGAGFGDLYLLGSGPGFECQADLGLVQATSGSNRMEFESPAIEEVWAELSMEFDQERRVELCHRIEEIAFEEAPLIFIWLQTDFYGVSELLEWKPRADERILFYGARWRN